MKKTILLLAAAAMLLSCKKQENTEGNLEEPAVKTYDELAKADWLTGSWENNSKEGNLSETWTRENDSVFHGQTFFSVGKDTVFSEDIRLAEKNGKLYYIPTVSDQNNGQPVEFEMTSANGKQLVFENPKHDFPQKITYNKITADSLVAEISGVKKGKPKTEQFAMKRAK